MASRRSARRSVSLALALSALSAGCGRSDRVVHTDDVTPSVTVVDVAAASDLQAVLPVLIARCKPVSTGVVVVPTFGASGQLAEQVRAGAPFDLFLAANRAFVRDLAAEGVIDPNSVRDYAVGSLVLVVPRDSGANISGFADLVRPEVKKVAIANPATAPYGAAAKQALQRAGLWDELASKLVIADSVRQALQYVQTGNAEAGLVGRAISGVPEVRSVVVDPLLYDPIVQGLGVVAKSPHRQEAEVFARFLLGDEARKVFEDYGFKRP
jgi:molybdate transport system substrate-binding protein